MIGHAAEIEACRRCPRLNAWCADVAATKKAAYRGETYWGKPVPPFGDSGARILVVGLAPGAHGANRTGRMFTGDRSGDWLYRAMHEAGLANQPSSAARNDGLALSGAFVTAVVRCAPPGNRPTPEERDRCLPFLVREFSLLPRIEVVVALGGFAWDGVLRALAELGHGTRPRPRFGHCATAAIGPYRLIGSYHPSQQNTFTGRLTAPMLRSVFEEAVRRLPSGPARTRSASPPARISPGNS